MLGVHAIGKKDNLRMWWRRGIVVLLALSCAATGSVVRADGETGDWRLSTRSHGVELYVRPFAGSAFASVRATGAVCASIETLADYLRDAAHFHDWVPDTVRAEQLGEPSAEERIFYLQTAMPWPLKDRDMVYRLVRLGGAHADNELSIGMYGVPDYAPRVHDVVRIESVDGTWHFVEQDGRTRIVLEMHVEPGGNIVPWLANRRIGALAVGMLVNLARVYSGACRA